MECRSRLIERGAHSGLWESAALGLLDRVDARFSTDPTPTVEEITASFWGACHGGQRGTAEYLLSHGADLNWVGWDDLTPLDAAERRGATDLAGWLQILGARSAAAASGKGRRPVTAVPKPKASTQIAPKPEAKPAPRPALALAVELARHRGARARDAEGSLRGRGRSGIA